MNSTTTFCVFQSITRHCFTFPVTEYRDMIHSMESFTFAKELDLNLGYYHIKLNANAQNLCKILFSWCMGKYKYKLLPMGIKIDLILICFKMPCLSFSNIWNIGRLACYLDDLLTQQITAPIIYSS
jgi:hypothetical protein